MTGLTLIFISYWSKFQHGGVWGVGGGSGGGVVFFTGLSYARW